MTLSLLFLFYKKSQPLNTGQWFPVFLIRHLIFIGQEKQSMFCSSDNINLLLLPLIGMTNHTTNIVGTMPVYCWATLCDAGPIIIIRDGMSVFPASTNRWINFGLVLVYRLRRWPNKKPAFGSCLLGCVFFQHLYPGKHVMLIQCWFKVGPASQMVANSKSTLCHRDNVFFCHLLDLSSPSASNLNTI